MAMRLAIIGQQDFGKAALEAFTARGDTVAGVFCAPEKEGTRPDALRTAAAQVGVPVFQPKSLQSAEAREAPIIDVDHDDLAVCLVTRQSGHHGVEAALADQGRDAQRVHAFDADDDESGDQRSGRERDTPSVVVIRTSRIGSE